MYIKRRSVSVVYRLFIGGLALACLLLEFSSFGSAAWRLFMPWVLLFTVIYYLLSAIITAFFKRRSSGRMLSPMFQGALTLSGLAVMIGYLLVITGHSGMPSLAGFAGVLAYFIVPCLILFDWLIFSKKGQWRATDPFYWLAFPVIYACGILLSANFTTRVIMLEYPYEFLNYHVIGIDAMLWWGAIIGVLFVAGGFVLVILDLLWSGKLAKYIVMPRIKTVVVEETIEEVEDEPEPRQKVEKIATKPVETQNVTKKSQKSSKSQTSQNSRRPQNSQKSQKVKNQQKSQLQAKSSSKEQKPQNQKSQRPKRPQSNKP